MLDVQFPVFPILETQRCLLRQVVQSDAADLFRLRSDEKVMLYIDREKWKSIDEALEMITKMNDSLQKGEGISWAINLKGDLKLIGMAGLWRIDKEHHRAEIGYTLLPEYWNKGLMTEAIQAIVHYGFYQIDLHSIEANINPLNIASRRILEKNGFVQEAYFRENYFFNGKFLDSAIFSLLTSKK